MKKPLKFAIDFDKKVVKIEADTNFYELYKVLTKMFKGGNMPFELKDLTIETNTVINWNSPVVIHNDLFKPYQQYPFYPQPTWVMHPNTAGAWSGSHIKLSTVTDGVINGQDIVTNNGGNYQTSHAIASGNTVCFEIAASKN